MSLHPSLTTARNEDLDFEFIGALIRQIPADFWEVRGTITRPSGRGVGYIDLSDDPAEVRRIVTTICRIILGVPAASADHVQLRSMHDIFEGDDPMPRATLERVRAMVEVMNAIIADANDEGTAVGPTIISNWSALYDHSAITPEFDAQALINKFAEIHATLAALAEGVKLLGERQLPSGH